MSHTTTCKSVVIKDIAALEQAVQVLKGKGINCSLERNAVPRMYYRDQIERHVKSADKKGEFVYHDNPEECDFVLRLPDAYYDVGFLKNKDGEYVPLFDDYDYFSTVPEHRYGSKAIKQVIGAAFAGRVEHWSGRKDDTEQTLHSIGGFLREYSYAAACNVAAAQGFSVTGYREEEDGTRHLVVTR